MECRICGLHWCVTWTSLANKLRRIYDNEKADPVWREACYQMLIKLNKHVDTLYLGKRPPRKV